MYDLNYFLQMIGLISLILILILLIKWVVGDFSPTTIDIADKEEIDILDKNSNIVGKKMLVIYKYTYRDGSIKYKSKNFKLK